ncbi:DUF547 domain-containing protein [Aquimarina algiphila]|uniref:DUF547 domain-containing protein n=1 Tax=Aquimarina algiphila TaxID=2047982 RepID=UPI00232D3615|nr:DUF547 domain-containing protein [Aquimarina algiphila]
MKNILFTLSICLFFSCSGSKTIAQNTTPTKIQEPEEKVVQDDSILEDEKKVNLPKIITPIEEKAPETEKPLQKTPVVTIESKKSNEAFDHKIWNYLLQKHVSAKGIVDYKGFKQDKSKLRTYLNILSENMPKESWNKSDKLAYWINAYNAFTVKLIIDNYPLKSIKDIENPWELRFIKLGAKWYTLNDIEHRILRKMKDPRIHFGINCASLSCPRLSNKSFTAQNVDQELEKLTTSFINDTKHNTISANTIKLSKIFLWFGKDFKTKGTLIQFLNVYSKTKINEKAKKSYRVYDWNLNES